MVGRVHSIFHMEDGTIFEHGDLVTRILFCLRHQEQERKDARHHSYLEHDYNELCVKKTAIMCGELLCFRQLILDGARIKSDQMGRSFALYDDKESDQMKWKIEKTSRLFFCLFLFKIRSAWLFF